MSKQIKEDEIPEEESGKETAPAERNGKTGAEKKQADKRKRSGKKKWIFIILLGILLGISGLGLVFKPDKFSLFFKKDFKQTGFSINEDNLSEENISPFFIPPGPNNKTIRIDLTMVWDGLASIRFRKRELALRSMMYEKFYETARQNTNLNEQISYLENEVSSMLRKSLGVQNLVVRIKEIRYF